ncbi:MAG: hypothetical protein WAS50_08415, partial [Nitrospira sp.]
HWWVRYRAAEALSKLPWMTPEKLTELCSGLSTVESHEHMLPFMAQTNVGKTRPIPPSSQEPRAA